MIGIYKITSPTSRIYIGQSVDIFNRISKYRTINCKEQPKLYNSLKKYGFDKHNFEILEVCEIVNLNERERYYQELYKCIESGLNCILTKTSDRSGVSSMETRLKISENNTRPFLGKKHSEESKLKIRNSLIGRKPNRTGSKLSIETKNKISLIRKGKKHSAETKLKMSLYRIGKKRNQVGKLILDKMTGIYHNSLKEAAVFYGIPRGTLSNYMTNKRYNKTNLIYV